MRLRPYTSADIPACLDLFASNTPLFFAPHERMEFTDFLERLRVPYFVVEDALGHLLACGGYWVDPTKTRAVLCWGMVHRGHHRRGVGWFLLLARLRQLYQDYGPITVYLDTSQHSYGFFMKAGFVVTEMKEHGYAPELHRYEMQLQLDADRYQQLSQSLAGKGAERDRLPD